MAVTVVLTDIEGTTCSISFVKDALFPFARAHLPEFVKAHAHEPAVKAQIAAVCDDVNVNEEQVVDVLLRWMDEDRKATPLKALQGMIWKKGYEDGTLTAHIYPDAVVGLERLHLAGLTLAVYSSGSVPAQKLLFGHTEVGDLSHLFSAWFDTTVGGKKEVDSYRRISAALSVMPSEILFLSDVEAELDAAKAAGLETQQVARAEDGTVPSDRHPVTTTFEGVLPEARPA
jgi:enolase-phosphatase E1